MAQKFEELGFENWRDLKFPLNSTKIYHGQRDFVRFKGADDNYVGLDIANDRKEVRHYGISSADKKLIKYGGVMDAERQGTDEECQRDIDFAKRLGLSGVGGDGMENTASGRMYIEWCKDNKIALFEKDAVHMDGINATRNQKGQWQDENGVTHTDAEYFISKFRMLKAYMHFEDAWRENGAWEKSGAGYPRPVVRFKKICEELGIDYDENSDTFQKVELSGEFLAKLSGMLTEYNKEQKAKHERHVGVDKLIENNGATDSKKLSTPTLGSSLDNLFSENAKPDAGN